MNTNGNCHVDRVSREQDRTMVGDPGIATLVVAGMGCPACVNRVYNAIALTDGVIDVDVSLETAIARVVFDAGRVDTDRLVAAVAAAGHDGRHNYRALPVATPRG